VQDNLDQAPAYLGIVMRVAYLGCSPSGGFEEEVGVELVEYEETVVVHILDMAGVIAELGKEATSVPAEGRHTNCQVGQDSQTPMASQEIFPFDLAGLGFDEQFSSVIAQ